MIVITVVLLVVALVLAVAIVWYISTPRRQQMQHPDSPYSDASRPTVVPGVKADQSHASTRQRTHDSRWSEDEVTYRAGSRTRPADSPRWDPYATEQSRVHRVREARHKPKLSGMPDYYALLGVERNSTDAQIERAYRKHAASIHPDRFFDDPERRRLAEDKLKELNAAMRVLRSPTGRAEYDAKLP